MTTQKSKWNGLLIGAFQRPNKWRLEKPLSFVTNLSAEEIQVFKSAGADIRWTKNKITVPLAYVTDLASVPRLCWSIIAPFDIARAAVVHDYLYEKINACRKCVSPQTFDLMRKIADNVFLDAMNNAEPEVPNWKKKSAYYAVRIFGGFAIKSSAPRSWTEINNTEETE